MSSIFRFASKYTSLVVHLKMIYEWIATIASVESFIIQRHHPSIILFNGCVLAIAWIVLHFHSQYTLFSLHPVPCKVFSYMLYFNLIAQLKPIPAD